MKTGRKLALANKRAKAKREQKERKSEESDRSKPRLVADQGVSKEDVDKRN